MISARSFRALSVSSMVKLFGTWTALFVADMCLSFMSGERRPTVTVPHDDPPPVRPNRLFVRWNH